ncbi:helix-turn-helix transcriptional regulator [Acinetobacter sp. YH16032]|uniref:helix-turn-helix transcriptional regulator n=1 Tax=Acinetobacter sp. YH16032 TaxID=2601181 RepID=UPI0015D39DB9|nr:helix-turn-helix transcriptional regulator [Acinetobacter sp. YH16032]
MLTEQENSIIELIYEAALQPKLWNQVLQKVAQFTNSTTAIYTHLDQLNPTHNFVVSHQIPTESLENYQRENLDVIDMKLHGAKMILAGVGCGYKFDSQSYAVTNHPDEEKFYKLCLKPHKIRYINAVLLEYGTYKWAVLAMHRSDGMAEYNHEDTMILERLGKHLRRSLQIYRQFFDLKSEYNSVMHVIEKLAVGVIILDKESKLKFSNQKAQKIILENNKLITIDHNQHLILSKDYQNEFRSIINSVLKPNFLDHFNSQYTDIGGVMCMGEGNNQIKITVTPLDLLKETSFRNIGASVAVFITQNNCTINLSKHALRKEFKLSPREIEICEHFSNGMNFNAIAEVCNITVSSLRTYMKTIYSKLECKSQVELYRNLMKYAVNFEHIN